MKRILYLYVLLASLALSSFAQSASKTADSLKGGPTLPTKCNPATSGSKADVFIKTGSSAGVYYCSAANTWTALAGGGGSGTGDFVGPASSTDNAVVRFDGTTGKLGQNSAVTIADTTGDITGGKYNKVTITAPATSATLTITDGKTASFSNSITFAGTDSTVMTFPGATDTIAGLGAAQTFTGANAFTSAVTTGNGASSGTVFNYNSLSSGDGLSASSSSATSGRLVNLAITGTAALTNNTVLNISNSGATSTNAQTTYGAIVSNTRTNATSGTNIALQLTASGATTGNTALSVTAGRSLFAGGTSAAPAIAFFTDVTSGLTDGGAGAYTAILNFGSQALFFQSGNTRMPAAQLFGWASDATPSSAANDLILRRAAAANLAHGAADASTAISQIDSVQNIVSGTSNTAGADRYFYGSQGTGTGAGGSIIFQTAPVGSTGTSVNALATALTINSAGQTLAGSDGSPTAPVFARASSTNTGVYFSGGNTVSIATGGTERVNFSGNGVSIKGSLLIGSNNVPLTAPAVATIQHGAANAASPVNQTISTQGSRSGTDTNTGGANLTIQSGLGTGTGTLSSLILRSPIAVASGTGAQTATTGLTIIGGVAQLSAYTVSTLPACSATTKGGMAYVTDATQTITAGIGATVAGSGSNVVPVFCDGTNWVIN